MDLCWFSTPLFSKDCCSVRLNLLDTKVVGKLFEFWSVHEEPDEIRGVGCVGRYLLYFKQVFVNTHWKPSVRSATTPPEALQKSTTSFCSNGYTGSGLLLFTQLVEWKNHLKGCR